MLDEERFKRLKEALKKKSSKHAYDVMKAASNRNVSDEDSYKALIDAAVAKTLGEVVRAMEEVEKSLYN